MKAKIKKLFSFYLSDTDKNIDNHYEIELVNCPIKEMMCNAHLTAVNKCYQEAEQYRKERNFNKSIETLRNAFNKASQLMEHPCTKCAHQYHLNIVESMVNINSELEEVSKGIFGDKNYTPVYLESIHVLDEFRNAKYLNLVQSYETKDRFLGNYLN